MGDIRVRRKDKMGEAEANSWSERETGIQGVSMGKDEGR